MKSPYHINENTGKVLEEGLRKYFVGMTVKCVGVGIWTGDKMPPYIKIDFADDNGTVYSTRMEILEP